MGVSAERLIADKNEPHFIPQPPPVCNINRPHKPPESGPATHPGSRPIHRSTSGKPPELRAKTVPRVRVGPRDRLPGHAVNPSLEACRKPPCLRQSWKAIPRSNAGSAQAPGRGTFFQDCVRQEAERKPPGTDSRRVLEKGTATRCGLVAPFRRLTVCALPLVERWMGRGCPGAQSRPRAAMDTGAPSPMTK